MLGFSSPLQIVCAGDEPVQDDGGPKAQLSFCFVWLFLEEQGLMEVVAWCADEIYGGRLRNWGGFPPKIIKEDEILDSES